MAGPLALVGGSPFHTDTEVEVELAAHAGDRGVVVLPTGAAYEHPQRLDDAAVTRFADLGVTARGLELLGRRDADDPEIADAISAAGLVYLAGQSPMHLRSVLKDTAAWEAIVGAWRGGTALAGTDAGASALCDPMVDPRGGAFTVGLGLLTGITVIPGFDTWSEDAVHRTRALAAADLVIVGVHAGSALVGGPDGWRSVGPVEPKVWVGGDVGTLADLPAGPS